MGGSESSGKPDSKTAPTKGTSAGSDNLIRFVGTIVSTRADDPLFPKVTRELPIPALQQLYTAFSSTGRNL